MDVFKVHEAVIDDYRDFTSGFVSVRDPRVAEFVHQQFAEGVQWPDPWVSLNPSFASGGAVPELVKAGLLHAECERIFRRKSDSQDPGRDPIVLHQHQREAIEVASTGKSYVLTALLRWAIGVAWLNEWGGDSDGEHQLIEHLQ